MGTTTSSNHGYLITGDPRPEIVADCERDVDQAVQSLCYAVVDLRFGWSFDRNARQFIGKNVAKLIEDRDLLSELIEWIEAQKPQTQAAE